MEQFHYPMQLSAGGKHSRYETDNKNIEIILKYTCTRLIQMVLVASPEQQKRTPLDRLCPALGQLPIYASCTSAS